jgi:hypothetical protein
MAHLLPGVSGCFQVFESRQVHSEEGCPQTTTFNNACGIIIKSSTQQQRGRR